MFRELKNYITKKVGVKETMIRNTDLLIETLEHFYGDTLTPTKENYLT